MLRNTLFLFLLFSSLSCFGQNTFGVNFEAFLPTGELKRDAPEIWGGGASFEGVFSIKRSPFHFGAILGWNHYGTALREGYHGPDLTDVRVRRNFENIKTLGLFRFKPDCGEKIFPYFDVLVGASNVYTRLDIRESRYAAPIETSYEIDNWAFAYGIGFGNEFFLSDVIILDIFFRTLKSNRIEYLSPDGVEFNTLTSWYDLNIRSSAFNHINFGFGIKMRLDHLVREFEGIYR